MVFSYQCEFKIIKDYHLISIVGVFFGSNHSIYFVVHMEWTKNHSVSISSNKYRAKNQLSRLFETHSPWLICYHSFVSARCFVVEVELKSESKYIFDFYWQCQRKQQKNAPNGTSAKPQRTFENRRMNAAKMLSFCRNRCFSPSTLEEKQEIVVKSVAIATRMSSLLNFVREKSSRNTHKRSK